MTKENNAFIKQVVIEEVTFDLITQFELVLTFSRRPDLLGFCMLLRFYKQIGIISFLTQHQLAVLMGITDPTFIKRKNELRKIGLLTITEEGKARNYHLKFFNRLKFFKSPKSYNEALKYLDLSVKSISISGEETQQLALNSNIYNNILSLKSNNKVISNKSNESYPKEHYGLVLTAYQKCKGIKLSGPEFLIPLRATKLMFKARHTPEQIIAFMEWLKRNEGNGETPWVRMWTIWTVQKKIAEFLAGKLKDGTIEEDLPRYG